jgi:hypothetical protein
LRAYSRLNWLALSYPTSHAAVVTDAPPAINSRRASSRRSSFWYCSGVVEVIALKCLWNDDALIPTRRASSGIAVGERMSPRMWAMARAMALAWLSWRMRLRSIPPNGATSKR